MAGNIRLYRPMIIITLAMGTGQTVEEGPDAINVTVARRVVSTVEYIHVNRIFQTIAVLKAIRELAGWPSELPSGLDSGANPFCLFFFFFNRCDFLAAIVKYPFLLMWDSLLQGLAIK